MSATGGLGQAASPQVLCSGCPLAVVQPGWGITCPYICCTVLVGLAWGGAQLVWLDTVWLATSLDEVQPLYQYLFCVVRNTYWRSWSWLGLVLETFGCVLGLAAVMFILSQAWWRWPFYNVFALIKEVVLILGRCCVMLGNYLCKCYTKLVNNSSPHHMVCCSSTIRPTRI